jgi:ATP-binding cassette subfamily C (CFTR/MRP) protein 1
MLTPAVTFTAFAITQLVTGNEGFGVETAFTSLALISILTNPVAELVSAATNLGSALGCLDRIQVFLDSKGRQDARSLLQKHTIPQKHKTGEDLQLQAIVPQSNMLLNPNHNYLVRVSNASFGWKSETPILSGINLKVVPSMLSIVIRPVGAGKSTLLQSLLGETYVLSGSVECASPKQIAFCDQQLWILNISIKQNIIGVSEYDLERYQKSSWLASFIRISCNYLKETKRCQEVKGYLYLKDKNREL